MSRDPALIKIRNLSLLGQHGAFGKFIKDYSENEKLLVTVSDQATLIGAQGFAKQYPNKFINFGISEQNAISVCGALAHEGFIPFLGFQACFASLRCADQIKVVMSYMKLPVKLLGLSSGLSVSDLGPTHYALQDLALFQSLPNIVILSPCDALEAYKCYEAALNTNQPFYIRVNGNLRSPMIYKQDYDFEVGKAVTIKDDGYDITIIATGTMVEQAIKATPIIEGTLGLKVRILNFHTIKPLDVEAIKSCFDSKLIVTIEEHSVIGGLGSAVNSAIALEKNKPPVLNLGCGDYFESAGNYETVLDKYGLSFDKIASKIINTVKRL